MPTSNYHISNYKVFEGVWTHLDGLLLGLDDVKDRIQVPLNNLLKHRNTEMNTLI